MSRTTNVLVCTFLVVLLAWHAHASANADDSSIVETQAQAEAQVSAKARAEMMLAAKDNELVEGILSTIPEEAASLDKMREKLMAQINEHSARLLELHSQTHKKLAARHNALQDRKSILLQEMERNAKRLADLRNESDELDDGDQEVLAFDMIKREKRNGEPFFVEIDSVGEPHPEEQLSQEQVAPKRYVSPVISTSTTSEESSSSDAPLQSNSTPISLPLKLQSEEQAQASPSTSETESESDEERQAEAEQESAKEQNEKAAADRLADASSTVEKQEEQQSDESSEASSNNENKNEHFFDGIPQRLHFAVGDHGSLDCTCDFKPSESTGSCNTAAAPAAPSSKTWIPPPSTADESGAAAIDPKHCYRACQEHKCSQLFHEKFEVWHKCITECVHMCYKKPEDTTSSASSASAESNEEAAKEAAEEADGVETKDSN